jgi:nitroimidazol reductase NimA-like FMN-containing flavoprotein (pyridoxamine 5'-phosphate oxidase superfamily)
VIVFGTARILSDDAEKRAALRLLIEKYAPNRGEETEKKLEKPLTPVNLVEISIERISGKESAELTEQRNQTEA